MIPNTFHFIFGLTPDFGGKPFSFVHYLAIKSAKVVNGPDEIFLHYQHEPSGHWWDEACKIARKSPVVAPAAIHGLPLFHFAHKCSVLRLQLLYEHGGIYMDLDNLCIRPFTPLLGHDMVMGLEGDWGLCDATILSTTKSEFLERLIDAWKTFDSSNWGHHPVRVPLDLSKKFPKLIDVQPRVAFFHPLWDENSQTRFHEHDFDCTKSSYSVHLWEQVTWTYYLEKISPESILKSRGEYARLARRVYES